MSGATGRPWPPKVSEEMSAEIRNLRDGGMKLKELSLKFGIAISTISKILNNRDYSPHK